MRHHTSAINGGSRPRDAVRAKGLGEEGGSSSCNGLGGSPPRMILDPLGIAPSSAHSRRSRVLTSINQRRGVHGSDDR